MPSIIIPPAGAFGSVELEMEYVESENLLKVTIARCKVSPTFVSSV